MREYLEAPLRAALEFCDELDSLIKRRAALVLDYDHHKRKLHAAAQRHEAAVAKRAEREQKQPATPPAGGGGGSLSALGGASTADSSSVTGGDSEEKDLAQRQAKLALSTRQLKQATAELLAQLTALVRVEPQLRESLYKVLQR
jgi:hypothetical protein